MATGNAQVHEARTPKKAEQHEVTGTNGLDFSRPNIARVNAHLLGGCALAEAAKLNLTSYCQITLSFLVPGA
jgi:hypothetical protein